MSLRDELRDLMPDHVRVGGRRVRLPPDTVVLDEASVVGGVRVTRTAPLAEVQKARDGQVDPASGYEKYMERWENEGRLRR